MPTPLVGSRYELHVTRAGAAESKAAKAYTDVYQSDTCLLYTSPSPRD